MSSSSKELSWSETLSTGSSDSRMPKSIVFEIWAWKQYHIIVPLMSNRLLCQDCGERHEQRAVNILQPHRHPTVPSRSSNLTLLRRRLPPLPSHSHRRHWRVSLPHYPGNDSPWIRTFKSDNRRTLQWYHSRQWGLPAFCPFRYGLLIRRKLHRGRAYPKTPAIHRVTKFMEGQYLGSWRNSIAVP